MNEKLENLKIKIIEESQLAIDNSINNGIKACQDSLNEISEKLGPQFSYNRNLWSVFFDEINDNLKEGKSLSLIIFSLLFCFLFPGFMLYLILEGFTFNFFQYEFNCGPFGFLILLISFLFITGKTTAAEKVENLNAEIENFNQHKVKLYSEFSELLEKNQTPSDFNLYISSNHYFTTLKDTPASKELLVLLSKNISMEDFEKLLYYNNGVFENISLDLIILAFKKEERKDVNKNMIERLYNN